MGCFLVAVLQNRILAFLRKREQEGVEKCTDRIQQPNTDSSYRKSALTHLQMVLRVVKQYLSAECRYFHKSLTEDVTYVSPNDTIVGLYKSVRIDALRMQSDAQ